MTDGDPTEIERLVAAEVERRIGGVVAQIGKDLADRYATTEQVQGLIDHRAKLELAAMNAAFQQAAQAIASEQALPEEHPLAALVNFFEDFTDVQLRVNMLSLYAVVLNKLDERGESGPDHVRRIMELGRIKRFVADLEHNHLLDWVEKGIEYERDGMDIVRGLVEVLGPRPEMSHDDD